MALRLIRMARSQWKHLVVAIIGLLAAAAMNLVTPSVVRTLTAAMTSGGALTGRLLAVYACMLIGAYLLRGLGRFLAMYYAHVAAWSFVAELTLKIYDKLQRLSMRYFQDKQTGQLMSRMVNDSRQIEQLVAHALPDMTSSVLILIGVVIMLFRIHPLLAFLTMIPVPIVLYVGTYFSRKVAPLFRVNQEVLGDLNGELQDHLSGMKEIQAFGQEDREKERLDALRARYADVNIKANFANGLFHPGIEFITSLGTVIVVAVGGMLSLRGSLNAADVVGFLMYLGVFYAPLTTLARLAEDVQTTYAGAIRVFEIIDAVSEIQEKDDATAIKRAAGSVRFDNVSFAYSQDEPVLSNVSFDVKPGKMIALVGPTGVGKTTLIALLERFYDPTSGRIMIDGHDIRDLTLSSLREQISIVLQDVFLFHGTIAENIAYGAPDASIEQIVEAAQIARADSFISAMQDGYQTIVGERGMRLSGGQKQRIAIARAVLRDTPILVLDEATSAVDTETEAEIQRAIEQQAGKRTLLVIAHRLSTIQSADNIIVLEKGRIVQSGTHDALVRQDGLYRRLYEAQKNRIV